MLISPEYQEQLRQFHASRTWGEGGYKFSRAVKRLAENLGTQDILDYGCGRGTLRTTLTGFNVREYDPGIEGKDDLPEPADIVVCTDVLEHIELACIDAVLDHLCGLTKKVCFVVISLRLAHSTLPDGRNAHLIVAGERWWVEQLETKDWAVELVERLADQMTVCLRK